VIERTLSAEAETGKLRNVKADDGLWVLTEFTGLRQETYLDSG
jgi:hypothetical protein